MFQRLYELGQILPGGAPWECFNEGMPDNYDRGLAICFDVDGNYAGVKTRYGSLDVVYRSGPPNGADFTPCSKLTVVPKTVERIRRAIKDLQKTTELKERQKEWLASVYLQYEQRNGEIESDIEEQVRAASIDKDHRGYLFLAAYEDDLIAPIYEWQAAKSWMVTKVLQSFGRHKKQTILDEEKACSVCGEINHKVFGNFSVLACYNLDKVGTISGGFSRTRSAQNFPVCNKCAPLLAHAITYSDRKLRGSSSGQQYLILPFASLPKHREVLRRELVEKPERFSIGASRDLLAQENAIMEYFSEQAGGGLRDTVGFSLIFFREDKASWRIQAEVNQVLPSRIKEIQEAISKIERDELLFSYGKDESKPLLVNTRMLGLFAENRNGTGNELRAWLTALFSSKTIQRKTFFRHLIGHILAIAKANPQFFPYTVRQAWGVYRFAILSKLIEREEDCMVFETPKGRYGEFITDHPDFFYRPELVTAFLTGCYASVVCGVQRQERGHDPFAKKFLGRMMDRGKLMRIYNDGHDKLGVYDKLGLVATDLDPDLAQSWIDAGSLKDWRASNDELSFAFTLGYSLQWRIRHLGNDNLQMLADETSESNDGSEALSD